MSVVVGRTAPQGSCQLPEGRPSMVSSAVWRKVRGLHDIKMVGARRQELPLLLAVPVNSSMYKIVGGVEFFNFPAFVCQ